MKSTVRRRRPLRFSGAFTHKLCRHFPSAVSAFGFITAFFVLLRLSFLLSPHLVLSILYGSLLFAAFSAT